ncbi:MAG: hypothetical protein JXA35_10890 [Deltaproteobacteria bacterium]|nr:hypothetical protein [Deltaproteobacteria bacterium]
MRFLSIMFLKALTNWLPRCLVIGFAASLLFPAPSFLRGMNEDMFLIWLCRLCWVLMLSVGGGLAFYILGRLRKKKVS